MERAISFKRFTNSKPETVEPKTVKADHAAWEFAEVGQSLDKAEPGVVKAVSTASAQFERKVLSSEEYQKVLSSVDIASEMIAQLTAFRATLIQKGYAVEGGITLSHSVSNGTDWLNARLYRQVKKTAEEANRDLISAL